MAKNIIVVYFRKDLGVHNGKLHTQCPGVLLGMAKFR